jgi:hypothetical protein
LWVRRGFVLQAYLWVRRCWVCVPGATHALLFVGAALLGCAAGMFAGASLLGVHMALTHSTITAMVAAYMPHSSVPGIGRLGGTAVSFTDFLLGGYRLCICSSRISLL